MDFWISGFMMDFWIHDAFLDFWIHDGFWFWVHRLFLLGGCRPQTPDCFYWGAAAPRPPAVPGRLPAPQAGSLQPPAPPRRFLRGSGTKTLVSGPWNQNGTNMGPKCCRQIDRTDVVHLFCFQEIIKTWPRGSKKLFLRLLFFFTSIFSNMPSSIFC